MLTCSLTELSRIRFLSGDGHTDESIVRLDPLLEPFTSCKEESYLKLFMLPIMNKILHLTLSQRH